MKMGVFSPSTHDDKGSWVEEKPWSRLLRRLDLLLALT